MIRYREGSQLARAHALVQSCTRVLISTEAWRERATESLNDGGGLLYFHVQVLDKEEIVPAAILLRRGTLLRRKFERSLPDDPCRSLSPLRARPRLASLADLHFRRSTCDAVGFCTIGIDLVARSTASFAFTRRLVFIYELRRSDQTYTDAGKV